MTETLHPNEMTLDELRLAIAPRLPAHAAFDGWTPLALERVAEELGVPAGRARLAFPGGATEMIEAWFGWIDTMTAATLPPERLSTLKIRARIRTLVATRIELMEGNREALRRALAILAQPQNVSLATRLAWRAADVMWRLAGDTAVDFNHYTKRLTLAGVYSSTMLVWLDDESEGHADTLAFLDRRIDNVMQFEKLKGRLAPASGRHFSVSRFLGRLRYPVT
jgi:ubiquinone biosynthesis protein COQ9